MCKWLRQNPSFVSILHKNLQTAIGPVYLLGSERCGFDESVRDPRMVASLPDPRVSEFNSRFSSVQLVHKGIDHGETRDPPTAERAGIEEGFVTQVPFSRNQDAERHDRLVVNDFKLAAENS